MQSISLASCSTMIFRIAKSPTTQVGEFLWKPFLRFSVLPLDRVLDGTGHRVVYTQHRALDQLDFSSRIASQTRRRCLPLLPGFRWGLRHGRLHTRPAIEPGRGGRILVGAIGENCYTRILQSIASQRIGGCVGVIELRIEGARLVPVEKGLRALGRVVFFFIAVSVLAQGTMSATSLSAF